MEPPSFADLDGDGDLDLVIGNSDGTLATYENTTPHGVSIIVTVTAETDTINGTPGNDTLIGTAGPNVINGLDGNDTITGGIGDDTVFGGAGNNRLIAGASGGFYHHGDDNDTFVRSTDPSSAFGGSGMDTLDLRANSDDYSVNLTNGETSLWSETYQGFENVLMGNGTNTVTGTASDNRMTGGGASDKLYGRAGNDRLFGGDGDDRLDSGSGTDTLTGGAGNDIYVVRNAGTVIVEGGADGTADRVAASAVFVLAAGDQIEVLTTTSFAGNSVINLTGNALAQRICGNAADNRLTDGLGAADILTGGAGNDAYVVRNAGTLIVEGVGSGISDLVAASVSFTLAADDNVEVLSTTSSGGATAINLTGNALTQTIIGNAGANRLNGGAGLDTVSGGLGADVFVITTALGATNIDRVTDYSVAADQIEIENAVFTGIFAGSLNAAAFASNIDGMATTATQRIVYETDTGFLWFDADGNGVGVRVQFADLAGGLTMTAAEFMVI